MCQSSAKALFCLLFPGCASPFQFSGCSVPHLSCFSQVYSELFRAGSNNASAGAFPPSSTPASSSRTASTPPSSETPSRGSHADSAGVGDDAGPWGRDGNPSGGGGGSGGVGRGADGAATGSGGWALPSNRLGVDVLLDAAGGLRQRDPGVMCAALKVSWPKLVRHIKVDNRITRIFVCLFFMGMASWRSDLASKKS